GGSRTWAGAGDESVSRPSASPIREESAMKRWILSACLILLAGSASAGGTAFQLGLPSLNIPSNPQVDGMRLSFLWGKNSSQSGLDVGVLSMSETSQLSGLALVGGVSKVTGRMDSGVALSLVNYHTGSDSGVNGAFINILNDTSEAFNTGFVIVGGTTM